jgi:hypothetical protein
VEPDARAVFGFTAFFTGFFFSATAGVFPVLFFDAALAAGLSGCRFGLS